MNMCVKSVRLLGEVANASRAVRKERHRSGQPGQEAGGRVQWVQRAVAVSMVCFCALFSSGVVLAEGVAVHVGGHDLYKESDYIIGVGDSVQISVWRNPDLSATVVVRPDGKISAPLVGDMVASSRTPMQLAGDITRKLSTYIRNPQVSVIMAGLSSHEYLTRVRVTGAVNNPASVPHSKGMTLLDIILDAGGVNDFAAPNRTMLYRTDKEGKTQAIKIRLNDLLKKGKLEDNILLQPGDVITVPESFF